MVKQEVNLDMLKKLVSTLEELIGAAGDIRAKANQGSDVKDYVIEMSKATGICMGIVQEAQLLAGDIHLLVKQNTTNDSNENKAVDKLFSLFKPVKIGGKSGGGEGGN